MTGILFHTRDDFEESYIVGLYFFFEDPNDDIRIEVPGFDSLTTKNSIEDDIHSAKILIGFNLHFSRNKNLDSTLVLKNIGRYFDEPTVQDDTFSKFNAIGRIPKLYYRLGSTEPAEGIISYIPLRSDGTSG